MAIVVTRLDSRTSYQLPTSGPVQRQEWLQRGCVLGLQDTETGQLLELPILQDQLMAVVAFLRGEQPDPGYVSLEGDDARTLSVQLQAARPGESPAPSEMPEEKEARPWTPDRLCQLADVIRQMSVVDLQLALQRGALDAQDVLLRLQQYLQLGIEDLAGAKKVAYGEPEAPVVPCAPMKVVEHCAVDVSAEPRPRAQYQLLQPGDTDAILEGD